MRELLLNLVAARYSRARHALDEIFPQCISSAARYDVVSRWYQDLKSDQLTIEVFLSRLTDEELIHAYESQCCQDFR